MNSKGQLPMNPEMLEAWQHRMSYNDAQAAELLEISRNSWAKYKAEGAPKVVALALTAVEHGLDVEIAEMPKRHRTRHLAIRHVTKNHLGEQLSETYHAEPTSLDSRDRDIGRLQERFVKKGFDGRNARWWAHNEDGIVHYWWTQVIPE